MPFAGEMLQCLDIVIREGLREAIPPSQRQDRLDGVELQNPASLRVDVPGWRTVVHPRLTMTEPRPGHRSHEGTALSHGKGRAGRAASPGYNRHEKKRSSLIFPATLPG